MFSDLSKFPTKESALAKLKEASEFDQHRVNVSRSLSFEQIERRFIDSLQVMTGGEDGIVFGMGKWIDYISGKKVLNEVVHSNKFRVPTLTGREKLNAIITDLLRQDLDNMPDDFVALRNVITSRIDQTR